MTNPNLNISTPLNISTSEASTTEVTTLKEGEWPGTGGFLPYGFSGKTWISAPKQRFFACTKTKYVEFDISG